MEAKTIGKFITTLRKANGMTQKDLAEKLNVSDKTVSRWERDEGAPDLSVIPVIAEIFGVTCDELLRGERKKPEDRTAEPVEETTVKGVKQRKRILSMGLTTYRNQTYLTMGISAVGLIAAMICNLGFLRAYIGFFVGAIFYVGSVVFQAICSNGALQSVSDDTIPSEEVAAFQNQIICIAKRAVFVTAVLMGATVPLIVFPNDTFMGLAAGSWLWSGLLFGAVSFVVCQIVWFFLRARMVRKGVLAMDEIQQNAFWHDQKLKRRCALILAILVIVTASGQITFNEIWNPLRIAEGETFSDYASFRRYMLREVAYESAKPDNVPIPDGDEVIRQEIWVYHDDPVQGDMVCSYVQKNMAVRTVRTSDTSDGLPVTAITYADYHAAERKIGMVNAGFVGLYLLECLAVWLVYRKQRKGK